MKKLYFVLPLFLLINRLGAVPSFDPFADATASGGTSYSISSSLCSSGSTGNGQTNSFGDGWFAITNTATTTALPIIVPGNLSYPGLPASTGNSVAFPAANGVMGRMTVSSAGVTTGPMYYSFIVQITDISLVGTAAANNYFAGFSDTTGAQNSSLQRAATRVGTKKVGTTNYVIGVSKSNTGTDYIYDSTLRNINDVLFIVGSYERVGGATNAYLWINPPASSFGSNAPPSPTIMAGTGGVSDINNNGIRAFVIGCRNTAQPGATFDELRVGKTWAFVTGGPEVGTQPKTQTLPAGTNAVLPVLARGTLPLSYQWQKNGTNLADGGNISGANSATLTISNLLQAAAGDYTVIVTNSYGSAISSIATLTVTDPAISSQPSNKTLPPGTNAVFTVLASGTAPLTYQWVKDVTNYLTNGINISGANSATLVVSNISASDVGTYFVLITNGLGNSIQSDNANLNLSDPAIIGQPQNRTNDYGTTATFQVLVLGTGPFTYQWHKVGVGDLVNGGNISGSQTNLLTITGVSFLDAGDYSVTVSNSLGAVDSATAILTVRDPIIVTHPSSVTGGAGAMVTFSVLAAGSPTLTYQWQRSSTNIADGGNWSGTTLNTLTINNISSFEAGTYRVIVTGGSGSSVTSSNAILTVLNPVVITNQPVSQTVVSGTNITFSVSATGTAPLHYQWQHDNLDIPNANLSTYTIFGVRTNDAGNYTVIVTNSINSVTSTPPVTLTVLELPPTIYSQPNSRTIAPGTRAVFVVAASGSLPLNYQWQKNGTNISGATSLSYIKTSIQSSDNGTYTVIVTNPVNSVTSAPVVLTVTTNLPLYETNLVVVRTGDGDQILATTGNSVYLDQFTISGVYVNTITIPETGSTGMIEAGPDLTGTTLTGTQLTRSPDKKFLVLPGYRVNLGNGTALQNTTSATVPRGIGLIDPLGQYTLALADTTAYDGDHFRGAAFDGAGNFWGAGSAHGTYYFGTNNPASTIQTSVANTRSVDIFNGNLYCLGSSAATGLVKFNGLPTIDQGSVSAFIPGASNATDFSVDPTDTLIYLTIGANVQKWQFDGVSAWTNAYGIVVGATTRYMTVDYSGTVPVLYVSVNDGRIFTIVDNGVSSPSTTLITPGVNQLFKGVRFGPTSAVAQPTLFITRNGNNVILNWSSNFSLQSASNVAGTYAPVPGATSPYTNSISGSQNFYRLKN